MIPYIKKERISLTLPQTQPALLIMDIFRGQMAEDILTVLKNNNILLVRVSVNMMHIFQPFHLMVNGIFKTFIRVVQ